MMQQKQFKEFSKNNRILMKALKNESHFDALAIISGFQQTSVNGLTKEFMQWYLQTEFQDICIFITKCSICVLAEEAVFNQLEYLNQVKKIEVLLLLKSKRSTDHMPQMQLIFKHIQQVTKSNLMRIGMLLGEPQSGNCMKSLLKYTDEQSILRVDCAQFLRSTLMREFKEKNELYFKSARINSTYMKKIFDWIEKAIEENDNITHFHLQKRVEKFKSDAFEQKVIQRRCGLEKDYQILQSVIQSGGTYDQNATENSVSKLSGDVVIVTLFCSYLNCMTYCQRTLIFQPDKYVQHIYKQIVNIQAYAIAMLKSKIRFDQVYTSSKEVWVQLMGEEFGINFPKDLGYVLGEDCYINESNTRMAENEMYIVVRVFVDGIKGIFPLCTDPLMVGIGVADTIMVSNNDSVQITKLEKELEEITYSTSTDGKKLEKESFIKKENKDVLSTQYQLAKDMFEQVEENKMIRTQELLKQKKQYELEQRLAMQQEKQEPKLLLKMEEIQTLTTMPIELPPNEIYVDQENDCVFIPIRGTHYVFHILTIKQVFVHKLDDSKYQLKFTFWTNEFQVDSRKFPTLTQKEVFLKELIFHSKNQIKYYEIKENILELKEKGRINQISRQQDQEKMDPQLERLLELPKGTVILYDIKVRPTTSPNIKSVDGHLECHQNGFRYVSCRQEVIDFTFANIRHAFYQSPEDEIIAAVHFIFKSPIKAQRRIYGQIQFYRDIKGAGEQEAARRQSKYCKIDVIFDQQVQKERMRHHKDFSTFISQCEQYIKGGIEFEKPDRKGSFEGNWHKERLIFQPTKSCLVNIVEHPFFILTVEDIDIMCCERVQEGTISFDLITVLKDLEANVIRIDAIDYSELKRVQYWMNNNSILFFVASSGLMWRNMQFSIQKDYPLFVYEGGWAKMMNDVMEHAPVQLHDDNYQIFEPDSSQGPTSISEFEFEMDKNNNPYLHVEVDMCEGVSDLVDSEDIMSELEEGEKRMKKKRKLNVIVE